MEAALILCAVAFSVLVLAVAMAMSARARRPPLRTRREEELAGDDEQAFLDSLEPARLSPIDRAAPILDAGPIEAALLEARLIEGKVVEGKVVEGRVIEGKTSESGPIEDARAGRRPSERPTEPGEGR